MVNGLFVGFRGKGIGQGIQQAFKQLLHVALEFGPLSGGKLNCSGPVGGGKVMNIDPIFGLGLAGGSFFQEATDGGGAAGSGFAQNINVVAVAGHGYPKFDGPGSSGLADD
jgi:hypothetical protein